MKIAIPVLEKSKDATMDSRFGRSNFYAIYDSDDSTFEFVTNPAFQARGGAGIQAVQFLADKNIQAVIVPHVGPNADRGLKSSNIEIFKGESISASELIEKWKKNQLVKL